MKNKARYAANLDACGWAGAVHACNNLVYNNVEAQIVKRIRTSIATLSASKNEKYNNTSALGLFITTFLIELMLFPLLLIVTCGAFIEKVAFSSVEI